MNIVRKYYRSCCNCLYLRTIGGRLDCINPAVDYRLLDQYSHNPRLMPAVCGNYKPRLVGRCRSCGQPIQAPVWSWDLWVKGVFADMPVCSRYCQQDLQKKLDERADNYKITFEQDENDDTDYPF